MCIRDRDKYVGEWKDGKENGNGKRNYPDGRNYVGEWKDGIEHGQGTFNYPDGKKYVGEWKKGNYWDGNSYDKNGNFVRRYVNGKEIKP